MLLTVIQSGRYNTFNFYPALMPLPLMQQGRSYLDRSDETNSLHQGVNTLPKRFPSPLDSCVKSLACLCFFLTSQCFAKAQFNDAIMYDSTAREFTGMARRVEMRRVETPRRCCRLNTGYDCVIGSRCQNIHYESNYTFIFKHPEHVIV